MRCERAWVLVGWVLLVGALWGCEPRPHLGPTPPALGREALIEAHNANVSGIPDFKAHLARWQLQLRTEEDTRSFNETGGTVIYRAPDEPGDRPMVYITASTSLENNVWVAGANGREYWWFSRRAKKAQWGYFRNIGKPCAANMPFNPYTLLDFAGLLPLADESNQFTLEVDDETYVVERNGIGAEVPFVERQYIFDRRTNLVVEVNAYGSDGQQLVHSEVGSYEQLGTAMVPREILLSWPVQDSYLRLKLNRFKIEVKDRAGLFIRPEQVRDIDTFKQIDRQCEP